MHNCRTIEFEKHSEQDLNQAIKKISTEYTRKQTFALTSQEDGQVITSLVSFTLLTNKKGRCGHCAFFQSMKKGGQAGLLWVQKVLHT